ncbi:MAG: nucleotide exchange factor GrpE [Candidatus Pacebacteria bacterium]|nr:nucleotide exchange factor GrpE [Candidatus Paceibacterota bacterium]
MNDDDVIFDMNEDEEAGGSEEELEAMESRADAKVSKLRAELEQTRKEKQENLDGWQRAKADYVNALKRFEDEKKAAMEQGTFKAANAFLPVIDSLERAKAGGELPEGFAGILKQLEDAAKKLGMVQIGEAGEKFDPSLHEALGQDPTDDSSKDDIVTTVLEPGWKAGDRVIRPAKVRVAHFEG